MTLRTCVLPAAVLMATVAVLLGQGSIEKVDTAMNARIRAEETDHSQVMTIEHVIADVYGPRPTGSSNHVAAANWAAKEMTSWGMKNAKLEPWNWGHEGWINESAAGRVTSPYKSALVLAALPWTPSTNGSVSGPVVNLVTPTGPTVPPAAGGRAGGCGPAATSYAGPTPAELDAYFATMAPKVKGAIVLVGAERVPGFCETEQPKRRDDDQTRQQYNPPPDAPAAGRGPATPTPPDAARLTGAQVNTRLLEFLKTNGAAVRVLDAGERLGIVRVQTGSGYESAKNIPGVMLRNEDYGRIARVLADGTPVSLEFNIVNRTFPEGATSYNVTAEIPGTDRADEVVMLGGHFDSWTSGTGATDNGIGSAIMMEAARILETVGAKPRRTIRVALWSGEEEGLLGSLAYVAQHFGTVESPKPEFAKLDAYWNIDSGTGLVRGASVFGPPEAGRILAQFIKPWEDLKIYGATTTSSRQTGGTDSTSFNHAGLPGIGGGQDPIEYGTFTHHTSLDTYERILPDDAKKDAMITASIVYHLAMRDQMMPRFSAADMPPLPGGGH